MDRSLALALQMYEDARCSGCGQLLEECMDPDLLEEWTTMHPVRCGACTALAEAAKQNESAKHSGALRYIVGLREGWQDRKAQRIAERAKQAG